VYTVRHRIAVRADDGVQVRSLDDIRKLGPGNVVLVLKGTAHEEMLRRHGGLALDASAQNLDVNLRKLQHGRGRFLYHTENALLRYIDSEKLGGQIKLLPAVLKEDNLLFAVSRSLPAATADMLRGALQHLADRGELKKIYANYQEE
jgi:ABC-type amino acid transport substrate-binding protein